MSTAQWSFGDRVVHVGKPEWGHGVISQALGIIHEGKPCQKLTIRFERAGIKTLTTAFAELRAVEAHHAVVAVAGQNGTPEPLDDSTLRQRLLEIPEDASDPFASGEARLVATIRLYRFDKSGGSLLDWAASQSGLGDPLGRLNRHELEELFDRFARTRDEHLRMLVDEVKRSDPAALTRAYKQASPDVQRLLKRMHSGR